MSRPIPTHETLADWVAKEAIPFAVDTPQAFDAAVDRVIAALGDAVELLGFGETLHGGEELLILRNRLFQRLVEAHGYSAIAMECSLPRSRIANDYVNGRGPASYEAVRDAGFSHGFGRLEANRELVEWMRRYNADPAHEVKLHFYGFDMPGVVAGPASPHEVLGIALDYLASFDPTSADEHRQRIAPLLDPDARWENPMPWLDPATSPDLVATLTPLRIATEDLIAELHTRRPELLARSGAGRYGEALHYASVARQFLGFFAALAGKSSYSGSLAVRDALMADNVAHIAARERGRGKVLLFAHNSHLQRGEARMETGIGTFRWWPAGAHLAALFGPRYAVIGSALGDSAPNGIARPEPGTLEALLTAAPGPARFIPTHQGEGLPAAALAALPLRSLSARNPSYVAALNPRSFTDFDWFAVLDTATYSRGAPTLEQWTGQ
jgi:erythromycin esterase